MLAVRHKNSLNSITPKSYMQDIHFTMAAMLAENAQSTTQDRLDNYKMVPFGVC
jgi:hypothetical protein